MHRALLLIGALLPLVTCRHFRIGYVSATSRRSDAAISMALDKVRQEGIMQEHNFTILSRYFGCSQLPAVSAEIDMITKDQVDVVFGHTCSRVCLNAGYIDTYYNIARFPSGCGDTELTDKARFATLVRSRPASDTVGDSFEQIFLHYGWKKAAIMARNEHLCEYGVNGIRKNFENINVTITDVVDLKSSDVTDEMIRRGLIRMRERTRIMILCHLWPVLQRIMLQAQALGMTADEFVFFSFDFLPSEETYRPWVVEGVNASQAELERNKEAFVALKQVTLASFDLENYYSFRQDLIDRFRQPPWNVHAYTAENIYVMFLADSAYMYFHILHELIVSGQDPRDGRLIFKKTINRRFNGWTGDVEMDANGDRIPHFWVWDCARGGSSCEHYGYISNNKTGVNELKVPYWETADGLPPPDTPPCGFRGDLCPKDDNTLFITIGCVVFVVILAAIVAALMFQKRQKNREKALYMMTWKVDYKDVTFTHKSALMNSTHTQSMTSQVPVYRSATSLASGMKSLDGQIFATVGVYSGINVAVKAISRPSVNLNRDLLVELKTLKDLVHENLNPFIGACIDPPNICVLSTYCSKGSLQDAIENDDINLDWMFKSSLLRDLVNGMCFLHDSPFKSHGCLKSTNCLIDSRWILKITGFGLARFRSGASLDGESEYRKYQKLLWTAPELLRMTPHERPLYGTQKGDVYSFGIILQELVYREAPFFKSMEPSDIVSRVRSGESMPYRPDLPESNMCRSEVGILMKRCWDEDPDLRPTFDDTKKALRKINKGSKSNIMDNMIYMLEKYATNLEGLVHQRTGELLDEKRKTDMLLHRMLPSSVADLLKQGKTVDPEMYDAVTIYFSDIVGFTSLSSSSTPMEVVNLLNDLYTTFDKTIEMYDVYKVETIGDAYMVVSGLPRRNDNRHAPEIADMALSLLDKVRSFKIRHRPGTSLNLRIGLHTGPCAAGVVGQTMPRYCLFGDTVNMASRMESTGEEQKIHISESTKSILCACVKYDCIERGITHVKGKGSLMTYWLKKKLNSDINC